MPAYRPTFQSDTMNDTISDSPPVQRRGNDYAIYKPNARGSGGVMRFGLNRQKGAMFVDAARQSGERQFDWGTKITMKWGYADLGAVLATLEGSQAQAKLFHKSEKANSAFELISQSDPERAPWIMHLSRQESSDQSVRKVRISMTHAEAAILKTAIAAAIPILLGW